MEGNKDIFLKRLAFHGNPKSIFPILIDKSKAILKQIFFDGRWGGR